MLILIFNIRVSIREGINGKGFNSKLALSKCVPLEQIIMPFEKKNEVGLQIPPLPQIPYRAYGNGQNLKI